MISKKIVLLLALCAAGSMAQLQAGVCVDGDTLHNILTTNGGICDIGAYQFAFQSWQVVGDTASTTPYPGGLTDDQVTFNTLLNLNGTGFLLTPTVQWTATGGGSNTDGELKYVVTGADISSGYQEVDGFVTSNAFDHVVDLYCLGGNDPGNEPCNGNPPNNTISQLDSTITGAGTCKFGEGNIVTPPTGVDATATACANSATFTSQTSISVKKDIDVNGGQGGGTGPNPDFAQITGVVNQWGGPVVPEPGTYVMSLLGLGLLFLGKRKLSRG